jgi:hypothetical protein
MIPSIRTSIVHRGERWPSAASSGSHSAKVPQVFIDWLVPLHRCGLIVVFGGLLGVSNLPVLVSCDEFLQTSRLARLANEVCLKKLLRVRTLLRVFPEAEIDELLERRREVALQRRRWVLRDEEEDLHGMYVGVWGLAVGHLECGDAERPDVRLMTSGAIQKGVPTKVFFFVMVAESCPETPKSASLTCPFALTRMLAASYVSI